MVKDFSEVIKFFALEEYMHFYSENQPDEKLLQKIKFAINESIQYHNFIVGDYSRYPSIFTDEYLMLILEHKKKENTQAVLKGQLSYAACLLPKTTSHNAFNIDLFRYGSGLNFFITTEAIIPIINDHFSKNIIKNNNLIPLYVGIISFSNENQLPKIKSMGEKTRDSLLGGIQRDINYEISTKHKEMCGTNKVDIYLLGSNVDQFFYIHTNPFGEKYLYKYNLLEGWFCEVDELDSATPESKGRIQEHIISRLVNPQYTMEFDVQPFIEKPCTPSNGSDYMIYPEQTKKEFARMFDITDEEMEDAIKNGKFDEAAKSALNRKTPLSDILHAIKKITGDD